MVKKTWHSFGGLRGDFAEDLDHFADKLGMDAVFRFLKGNQRGNVVEIEQGSDCEQSQHAITDLAAIIRRGAGSLALVKHHLAANPSLAPTRRARLTTGKTL